MRIIILSATMLASAIILPNTPAFAAKRIHCIKEPVNTSEWFGSCDNGQFGPSAATEAASNDPTSHSRDKPKDNPDIPPVVDIPTPGWPPIIVVPPPDEPPAIAKPSRKGKADHAAGRKGHSFKGPSIGSHNR